jgi:hypothetical protein
MAVVALITGRNVIDRFAGRAPAVMTIDAATEHFEVIDPHDRAPRTRAVARFALLCREVVARRFARRANAARRAVALHALLRRTDEHTVHMATAALSELMCAVKAKRRRKVVE